MAFGRFYLSPMDGPDLAANTAAAVRHCLENPRWSLSLQLHKHLGLR
jgi:7-carboxy-7-deazaguanine synthase